nr:hypothetical protein [Tanacetum cinerariifolium]
SSAAGTDNRPPMLEENDYESRRIRIERYIKGKAHGKLIWKSIQNGPTPHPQTTDRAPEGGAVPPPRNKRDEEFTAEDNRNELEDIQAINILISTQVEAHSQEYQPKDQLGVLSVAKVLADASRKNAHTYTRRRRVVSTGSGRISTASRLFSTAEESVSTVGASMPVSTAEVGSSKRVAEAELDYEGSKRQKTNKALGSVREQPNKEENALSQEDLQQMMMVVPVKEVYVEALQAEGSTVGNSKGTPKNEEVVAFLMGALRGRTMGSFCHASCFQLSDRMRHKDVVIGNILSQENHQIARRVVSYLREMQDQDMDIL